MPNYERLDLKHPNMESCFMPCSDAVVISRSRFYSAKIDVDHIESKIMKQYYNLDIVQWAYDVASLFAVNT